MARIVYLGRHPRIPAASLRFSHMGGGWHIEARFPVNAYARGLETPTIQV